MKKEKETAKDPRQRLHRQRQQEQRTFTDTEQHLNTRKQSSKERRIQNGIRERCMGQITQNLKGHCKKVKPIFGLCESAEGF